MRFATYSLVAPLNGGAHRADIALRSRCGVLALRTVPPTTFATCMRMCVSVCTGAEEGGACAVGGLNFSRGREFPFASALMATIRNGRSEGGWVCLFAAPRREF